MTCAILDGVAKARKKTMAEVIAEDYGTKVSTKPFMICCQSGDDRYTNVDKMIMKKADVMPHGLINNLGLLGEKGEKLVDYAKWVRDRILTKGESGYKPIIHIDTYGTPGILFKKNVSMVAELVGKLAEAAKPLELWCEMPIDAGSTETQIATNKELMNTLRGNKTTARLVVDEWCTTLEQIKRFADAKAADVIKIKTSEYGGINNIIESVLYAKKESDARVWLADSCNTTNKASECSVHVALATNADAKSANPGMGVDEGMATVYNEMHRALALLRT
jgi:methylaspartate ammonia-lyase